MGILQSCMQCFGRGTDDDEGSAISSLNSYYKLHNNGTYQKSEYGDRDRRRPDYIYNVFPPGSRSFSSSLNDRVESRAHTFTKQNTADHVNGDRIEKKKKEEEERSAKIKMVEAAEGRWVLNRNQSTMKHPAISVPGSKNFSSISSLNDKVDSSSYTFTNQKTACHVNGDRIKKKKEEEGSAKIKMVEAAEGRWILGNPSTMKHPAISVPISWDFSSSFNDKVESSAHIFAKQNTADHINGDRIGKQKKEEEGSVKIKRVEAAEGRSIMKGKQSTIKEYVCMEPSSGGKGEQKLKKQLAMAREDRWIKHYSSCHRILLVGEGDFSFSTCLAKAFGGAPNMVATSLNSQAFLEKNYRNALNNLSELSIRKCKVMHEIDATEMANHALLGDLKFDRIIYNFPHAGFFKDLSRTSTIQLHRRLVSQFLKNAKEMVSENGEIHITHKTNGFHREWRLESVASSRRLRLVEADDFSLVDYPGYNTKYGFGGDNNFNCHPSKTYKFRLY